MNEEVSNAGAAFMEVSFRKIENQEKRIAAVEEKINNIPYNTQAFQKIMSTLEGMKNDVKTNRFPTKTLEDFTQTINESIGIYKELVKRKIVHHHHVPKIIWIAAGLFVAFSLVCAGWYSTANKLDGYIANDTKYRKLRLDTSNKYLQFNLDFTDSLYNIQTDMRKTVLAQEEDNRKNFERLLKAERLKEEAKELEKAVKKKSPTSR